MIDTADALRMSRELGLDLVEIAPQERPPVCRIMDYGKHKYNIKKRQKQQASHEITLKEVRLRPKTDDNDRLIKMKRADKFIEQGHKVQFTMLFRGRERQHRDIAFEAMREIVEHFGEEVKIERPPKFEGRRMTMVLAPLKPVTKKKPSTPKKEKAAKEPVKAQETPASDSEPQPVAEAQVVSEAQEQQ